MLDLGFLADKYGKRRGRGGKPYANERFNEALSIGTNGSSHRSQTFASKMCPWFDEETQREQEFIAEMRLLSTLRHPCICTVMGAVVERGYVPMLVLGTFESKHAVMHNTKRHL